MKLWNECAKFLAIPLIGSALAGFATSLANANWDEPRPIPAVFKKHVVVAQDGESADVGREILRRGGNALDAAVATAFALAVTHPAAGNLGGGGFLVAFSSDTAKVATFDFREVAPKASAKTMYLEDGTQKLKAKHRAGLRAGGIPGTVKGLGLAHSRLGKLPWSELVLPAVQLAREGFVVSGALARSLNAQLQPRKSRDETKNVGGRDIESMPDPDRLGDFTESVKAYGKPDGTPWREGDRIVQPNLAATLERIAAEGASEFYQGKSATLIVEAMKRQGGLITLDDLAAYEAKERPPIHTTFRGFDVYGMGPVASGGIVIAQMLNILETFDLKADGPHHPRTLHRVTEAMRRAFYTRATAIADPAFVEIPVERLISKEHARDLARSIGARATPSASLASFPILAAEGSDTTHLSTLDANGNAVALTYTLEESYGSKAVVGETGFLLNNEMGDFNLIPGRTDTAGRIGTEANQIVPGKRMLSSQSPTIVLSEGKIRLVTGSPGGRTIPNTVLWVALNVLEFGLDPEKAVSDPRTHHAWFPDQIRLEGKTWRRETVEALKSIGHSVVEGGIQGDAHTIVVDPNGTIHGIADRRQRTEKASGD